MLGALDLQTALERLTYAGYTYETVPEDFCLTPESRDAIREDLSVKMDQNDSLRAASLNAAAGLRQFWQL